MIIVGILSFLGGCVVGLVVMSLVAISSKEKAVEKAFNMGVQMGRYERDRETKFMEVEKCLKYRLP